MTPSLISAPTICVRRCNTCACLLTPLNRVRGRRFYGYCRQCWSDRANKWRAGNQGHRNRWQRSNRAKYRAEVLGAYGNKCACCGETTPEFLTLDHINNDGAEHRRRENLKSLVFWARKNKFPKTLQLYCWNCNCGKRMNNGVCPHKKVS